MREIENKYSEHYKNDVRFNSESDVKRFLSRVINLRANDLMDSDTSRDLGYLCGVLLKSMQSADNETVEDKLNTHFEMLGKIIDRGDN